MIVFYLFCIFSEIKLKTIIKQNSNCILPCIFIIIIIISSSSSSSSSGGGGGSSSSMSFQLLLLS